MYVEQYLKDRKKRLITINKTKKTIGGQSNKVAQKEKDKKVITSPQPKKQF